MRFFVVGLLLFFGIANSALAQTAALRCSEAHRSLRVRQILGLFDSAERHRLGIGVYGQTVKGDHVLGVSPYSGALHRAVVRRLHAESPLQKILWMGELRYDSNERYPQIVEANETSGFFQEIQRTRGAKVLRSIAVENDVRNLPEVLLKRYFEGRRFQTAGESRLAHDLRNIDGNIRHGVGNSIQMMTALIRALHRPDMTREKRIELLSSIAARQTGDVGLVKWMIRDLLNERRVRWQDVDAAYEFVTLVFEPNFSNGHVQVILGRNVQLVVDQLMFISEFNQGRDDMVPFQMWVLRDSH